MREPRASYICNFDAKNSALSNYRRRILDEISIKSGGWLGPTPNGFRYQKKQETESGPPEYSTALHFSLLRRGCYHLRATRAPPGLGFSLDDFQKLELPVYSAITIESKGHKLAHRLKEW